MDSARLKILLGNTVRLVYKDVACSTNDDAKQLARTGLSPILVIAERQSSGRGRNGHAFASPIGGIYMTLALPAALPAEELDLVTSYVGRCVCEAIEETCALQPDIKWVNDIYVCNRKLAGILVELIHVQSSPHVIVGIGINGYTAPELPGNIPTACLADYVQEPDLEEIVAHITRKLINVTRKGIDRAATVAYCRMHSMLLGKEVTLLYGDSHLSGYAVNISDYGKLVVNTGNQIILVSSAASNIRLK